MVRKSITVPKKICFSLSRESVSTHESQVRITDELIRERVKHLVSMDYEKLEDAFGELDGWYVYTHSLHLCLAETIP